MPLLAEADVEKFVRKVLEYFSGRLITEGRSARAVVDNSVGTFR